MPQKKPPQRRKHIPQRTCVGCREVLPKRTLIRIVRTSEGIEIDPTGKKAGRGAYLHNQRACWERGMKGSLSHALKVELDAAGKQVLMNAMALLPESDQSSEEEVDGG